jgi:hypothetical protein
MRYGPIDLEFFRWKVREDTNAHLARDLEDRYPSRISCGAAERARDVQRDADLTVRVKLPGDYERPGEIVECTPLGYALLFGGASQRKTVTLLRERGVVE